MNTLIKIGYPSIRLLTDALEKRGYTYRDIPAGVGFREFTSPGGKKWLTNKGFVSYPFIPHAAAVVAHNKRTSYSFAEYCDVVIPATIYIPKQEREAADFMAQASQVIAKPLRSYGSHGMTLDITTLDDLRKAVVKAQEYNPTVIVQKQFSGEEVRFTILNGKVVHCLLRETPRVVGNGHDTVKDLIAGENAKRRAMKHSLVPYPDLDEALISEHFLRDDTILAEGETLELSKSTLVGGGANMHNVTDKVDETYKQAAERLAQNLSPAFLTVDMLVRDYTQPASENNYVFLECNVAPSLRLYYDVRTGADFDIVSQLADTIDTWLKENKHV